MSNASNLTSRPWFGLIRRGESSVAPAGMALIGTLALAMAAAGWWATRSQTQSLNASREQEVRAAGNVLSELVESLVLSGELSTLRRLVMNTAQQHKLDLCRVVMPDGGVIADGDPSRITVTMLPTVWDAGEQSSVQFDRHGQQLSLRYPLFVAGRGGLVLELTAGPHEVEEAWATEAGIGVIGVVSLVALLLVYRQMRGQVRPLAAISESLHAMAHGESTTAALAVSPVFGKLASTWNNLLLERQGKWEQRVEDEARAAIDSRHAPGGELADACNALSQGLVLVDEKLHVIYANGAAGVFLGKKRDELLGCVWAELKLDSAVSSAVMQAASGSSRQRCTLEVDRLDGLGDGVLRFSVRPVMRGDAPAAVVIIDDITQQRVAERSRNTFIAQATHELRMPLTNIRLYVETALESGDDDAELRGQCLNVINSESRRLEGLVTDMLSISEIEAGSMSLQLGDVRLDALFEELENDYRAAAREKAIEMSFALPPKLPVVQADRDRLFVAFQNLVGNAIKYTPKGGRVEVVVEAATDVLTMEVKDTGIGISETDMAHVFDRFYRAEDKRVREVAGSGLGLALSREVVRLHGGDIAVDSELNRGTTFTLTLPIANEVG